MTDRALEALARGQIIGLPTDTVYGIAVDPFREEAMELLFSAKGRPGVKPIPILAGDLTGIRRVALLDDELAADVTSHWPGGLTVVLHRAAGVARWIGDWEAGTVAVRIPDHPVALGILLSFGPLAVTSANRSGEPPAVDDIEARAALGDLVAEYLTGRGSDTGASTVVDLTGSRPRILRAGAVEWGRP